MDAVSGQDGLGGDVCELVEGELQVLLFVSSPHVRLLSGCSPVKSCFSSSLASPGSVSFSS